MDASEHFEELPRYGDWRPTPFDPAGLALDDRADWRVCPVSITRDTRDSVTLANWQTITAELDKLDPDCADHEEHRFGHWGPGWFEIVIVRPGTACANTIGETVCALADYPVLDEDAMSAIEVEQQGESWEWWISGDVRRALDSRLADDDLELDDRWTDLEDTIRDEFESTADQIGECWESRGDEGPSIRWERVADAMDLGRFRVVHVDQLSLRLTDGAGALVW